MAELRKIFKVEGYKRVLLHANGFKSIYPVRRENPGLSDSEIYEQLLKNWNELVDTVENIDKRVQAEKEAKKALKRYTIVIKNKVAIFEQPRPDSVEIKDETINETANGEHLIIRAKNAKEAKQKAEKMNEEKYNLIWDGHGGAYRNIHHPEYIGLKYCIVTDSYDIFYILLETVIDAYRTPKKETRNILDEPMFLSLPYETCFLKHFNSIDKVSYVANEGECVLRTLFDVLNRDARHFSFQFLRDKFNEACIFCYGYNYEKKLGITARMLK
jgi:hypothetical protein